MYGVSLHLLFCKLVGHGRFSRNRGKNVFAWGVHCNDRATHPVSAYRVDRME